MTDATEAMGGAGSMDRWVDADPALGAADRVHLTSRGYRTLGELVAAALLGAYDASRSAELSATASGRSPDGADADR